MTRFTNILLPNRSPSLTWDIEVEDHKIKSIQPHSQAVSNSTDSNGLNPPAILLPTLCHPHVHLDKAYLLTSDSNQQTHIHSHFPSKQSTEDASSSEYPDYQPLQPKSGSFKEALSLTSQAKELCTPPDLRLRGAQLLSTSLRQGITSCRAFVEVDHVTQLKALESGLELKRLFKDKLRVQIVAFAQDPIFSGEHGDENRRWMEKALETYASSNSEDGGNRIEVLGSTPYVESDQESTLKNIDWAITTALKYGLHLDFHLDYNLDESQQPMVWDVIRLLKEHRWAERSCSKDPSSTTKAKGRPKTVVLGHCTRLALFSSLELTRLSQEIQYAGLTSCLSFVGLPTSDLFMMGRPASPSSESPANIYPSSRPRGTLNIPALADHLDGVKCCIGVNNMGNAFTPFGSGDLLELASWCVGFYHTGTERDAEKLFWAVSGGARECIGLDEDISTSESKEGRGGSNEDVEGKDAEDRITGLDITEGIDLQKCYGLLLVRNEEYAADPDSLGGLKIPARWRMRVRDVVWDPPGMQLRSVVR